MTARERAARIVQLRKEYRRLLLAGRTTTANKLAKELAGLVTDRLRDQLRGQTNERTQP